MSDAAPQTHSWPASGLQHLGACPVCGHQQRGVLHARLTDEALFGAPGDGSMMRCRSCHSGYLDLRPTPDSIGLAYGAF